MAWAALSGGARRCAHAGAACNRQCRPVIARTFRERFQWLLWLAGAFTKIQ
jgi:hypothetical protein